MKELKVIFHVDELAKWKLTLNNANNLIEAAIGREMKIEVLANAEAVKYYDTEQDDETQTELMESLNEKGVRFVACNNALNVFQVDKQNLISFISIVPAGVLELAEKQSEGYSYIRP